VEAQANGLPILVSTNITNELKLTNVIKYKSLSDGAWSWAEYIVKFLNNKNIKRSNTFNIMTESGFNIDKEAEKLEKLYFESGGKNVR
jgi:hypothetical protein